MLESFNRVKWCLGIIIKIKMLMLVCALPVSFQFLVVLAVEAVEAVLAVSVAEVVDVVEAVEVAAAAEVTVKCNVPKKQLVQFKLTSTKVNVEVNSLRYDIRDTKNT